MLNLSCVKEKAKTIYKEYYFFYTDVLKKASVLIEVLKKPSLIQIKKMNNFWKYWQLITTEKGRQYWQFTENDKDEVLINEMFQSFILHKGTNKNSADKVYRYFATKESQFKKDIEVPEEYSSNRIISEVYLSTKKGINYYKELITSDHFITGDYGGPMFLLPGLIITAYVTDSELPKAHQALMKAYIYNQQNEDGGWGLHIEGHSTMFGSCLNYVALRLLGEDLSNQQMQKGQQWILNNGGATKIASWGKFYLSVLNVYEWEGNNSFFPEMWLLPKWLPFHPSKYWCHARMVYLPMAYCYGKKLKHPLNKLTQSIRNEIYTVNYKEINWSKAKDDCAATDVFRIASPLLKVLNSFTSFYEKIAVKSIRKKALDYIISYVNDEDKQTNYINIGPVNQVLNSLCIWSEYGKNSTAFQRHQDRWKDYLWVAEDGMKMQGYNGAQFWETAFTMNAIQESKIGADYKQTLQGLYSFIDICQIKDGIPKDNQFFRHANEGGFPFSTVEHAWPITDCTADGIKTIVKYHQFNKEHQMDIDAAVSKNRLEKAVDLVLSFQGKDGGWASYEKRRAPFWIEALNPSEVFGEIMVDYPYTECSSSSIQGLASFTKEFPDYKQNEISTAIKNGIQFIKNQQGEDGSWYGSWGVCYTYAAWFAIEALACANEFYNNSAVVKKGCDFLIQHQNKDGAWGESFESCVQMKYVEHEQSQIINTAWALLSLMQAQYPNQENIEKGIKFLISRQDENGDFPQEGISGVFNKNCMETYTSYRNVFPIWALNRYLKTYK